MKSRVMNLATTLIPLAVRRPLAIWLHQLRWIDGDAKSWWQQRLLVDFARQDRNAYHKFLWKHHLAYARTYEVSERFGYANFNETRRIFFSELPQRIADAGLGSTDDFDSVLDVGCSLGYLLRYMETDVFKNAKDLVGIDLDSHAIENGRKQLRDFGSNVDIREGDMEFLSDSIGDRQFDFVFGSGILLYLDEPAAREVVTQLLRRTNKMLAITGLAHPKADNRLLTQSVPRRRDGTWIHNVDGMIEQAGGTIVARRWEHGVIDGNTIYFVYARP